ncbi:MAG: integration host factor subunit beta [Gammaproteobacteria bacterium]|nr:integration host factor subunit beta [Gammaproteobacteria bacterium]|tara:strand:+ start:1641 stop:1994 length:354 start_codon:yes stop_codon:yes gene_type:complete
MTKSELIERVAQSQTQLAYRDIELAVKTMLELMAQRLANGERIEIRGFGSFSLHYRPGRVGRNPKTGDPVSLTAKYVPHFKPGKELRERVDNAYREEGYGEGAGPDSVGMAKAVGNI